MKRCKNCGSPVSIHDAWCKACIEPIARSASEIQRSLLGESKRTIEAAANLGDIPQEAWDAYRMLDKAEAKIGREG